MVSADQISTQQTYGGDTPRLSLFLSTYMYVYMLLPGGRPSSKVYKYIRTNAYIIYTKENAHIYNIIYMCADKANYSWIGGLGGEDLNLSHLDSFGLP